MADTRKRSTRTSTQRMTTFERQRRDWCLAGHAVLANGHAGIDEELRAWAKRTGRLLWIDRRSVWGNPAPLADPTNDEEREACVRAFAAYFETEYDLRIRLGELKGKVLVCWCTPKMCHGEVLLCESDPQFAVEYMLACRDILPRAGNPAPENVQLLLL